MEFYKQRLPRNPTDQLLAWHRDLVAERVAKLNEGEVELIDWEGAKARLAERAKPQSSLTPDAIQELSDDINC